MKKLRRGRPRVTQSTKAKRLARLRREQRLMAEGVKAYVEGRAAIDKRTGEVVAAPEHEWIEKLPGRLASCGQKATFRPCARGHVNQVWVSCCDAPICIFAQAKKSARHLLTVRRCLAVSRSPVYAVLTLGHCAEDELGELVGILSEGVKRLKAALKRKRLRHLGVEGVLVKHEVTRGSGSAGMHPHLNLLIESERLHEEQETGSEEGEAWLELRSEWLRIVEKLGREAVPEAQYCGRLKDAGEIAKYLSKLDLEGLDEGGEPLEPYERGRLIVEVAAAYRNKRTIQGSGIFFKLEPTAEELEAVGLVADLDNGDDHESCHVEGCSARLKERMSKPWDEVMAELARQSHLRLRVKSTRLADERDPPPRSSAAVEAA